MTVNTNGNKFDAFEAERIRTLEQIDAIEKMTEEVRESQLRTEKMVRDFVENMSKNPMFKMFATKFGG